MAVIEIKSLSKWYGEVIGFSNITCSIEAGVVGLLGPNGAGKSTLFKVLTGQIKADTGTATVAGEPVWSNANLYKAIGYCPDVEKFYEEMTGIEFLTYISRLHGNAKSAASKRAWEMLEHVGLTEAAHRRIGGYSKGMRQRIKLAQAITHDPQVVFLDEPLSGMDPDSRFKTVRWIREIAEQGKTVLVSSHILHEVEEMTKRVLVLNNGMLLAEGDVFEIRELIEEQPRHVRISTSERQRLSGMLVQCEEVQTIRFGDDPEELIVQTTSPEAFFSRIERYVLDEQLPVREVSTLDENLQSVFEYLVKPV